jgi:hypothetical protein
VASALTDECGNHLHPGGVDALQSGDIERYGLRFVEEAGEALFEGIRIGDGTLGRQGECGRRRFLVGCRLTAARARAFVAI